MPLPDDFIYSLKQNNPIDSVMSGYVSLKKQSRDYVCLCPFHSEKTPSCSVRPTEGYFHCFGCGAGGDVITFIMKMENLEYIEAVKFLAERAGMSMPDEAENNSYSKLKNRIFEINRTAAKFLNYTLTKSPEGEKGRRYFAARELMPKTIIKYGLGYAPDKWHYLSDHLKSEGYSDEEIIAANLAGRTKKGDLYDLFRDRVIFPIIDLRGNVIAFGGRIIDGDGPKYLNSSDTAVFKKSRNLFSLNFAKKSNEKRLILAEGYMDVISINQAGFENTVATLGTSLTPEQARLMAQYAEEIIICYDSDSAGQTASARAINLLSEAGLRARVIRMEGAKDPDEYIKKFGSIRFKQLLDNSDSAVNFELEKCKNGLDISSEMGKIEYLKKSSEVIAKLSSPIERDIYISKIADSEGVSKKAMAEQVDSLVRKNRNSAKKSEWQNIRSFSDIGRDNPDKLKYPARYRAETGLLSYLVKNPEEYEFFAENVRPEYFVNEIHRKVFIKIPEYSKNNSYFDIYALQSEFTADEMGRITNELYKFCEIDVNKQISLEYADTITKGYLDEKEHISAGELSDDEFRELAQNLRRKM